MRGKKLQRQLNKNLDYDEVEGDLTGLVSWVKAHEAEAPAQNILKIVENFSSFLDIVEESYEQYESSLNTAQRNLEVSSKEVEEKNKLLFVENRKVSNLLNNMKQSVFTVDGAGTVIGPVSKFSETVFESDVVDKNVFDVLYPTINRESEEFAGMKSAFIAVFGESELQWDLMCDYFPTRVLLNSASGEKILKVTTSPIWDEKGNLEKIMYISEDVTELEALTRKIELERQRNGRSMQIVQELIASSVPEIKSVMAKFYEMEKECLDIYQDKKNLDKEDINLIFRHLHTIKGNSRSFNLSFISATTHRVESEFCKMRDVWGSEGASSLLRPFFEEHFVMVKEVLNQYQEMIQKISSGAGGSKGAIISDEVKEKLLSIKDVCHQRGSALTGDDLKLIDSVVYELAGKSSFSSLSKLIRATVENTAHDCEKNVEVEIAGEHFELDDKLYSLVADCLIHMAINAVDHGIEDEAGRIMANKPLKAKLKVDFKCANNLFEVAVSDDGRGIDLSLLKNKAVEKGLYSRKEVEAFSDKEVVDILFTPGFSTKEVITETSGRGVGLDVVRQSVLSCGGEIKCTSKLHEGTKMYMAIPFEAKLKLVA
ncbi:MAG: ATP-binding protein [Bacteriovorax sp.]